MARFRVAAVVPPGRILDAVLAPHGDDVEVAPYLVASRDQAIEAGRRLLLESPDAASRSLLGDEERLYAWSATEVFWAKQWDSAGVYSTFNRYFLFDRAPGQEDVEAVMDAHDWRESLESRPLPEFLVAADGTAHPRWGWDFEASVPEEQWIARLRELTVDVPPGSAVAIVVVHR